MLLLTVAAERAFGVLANHMSARFRPAILEFFTNEFVRATFRRHEVTREPINVALLIHKIRVVVRAIDEVIFYLITTLFPLLIVLVIATIRVFAVHPRLGAFVLLSLVITTFTFSDHSWRKNSISLYIFIAICLE